MFIAYTCESVFIAAQDSSIGDIVTQSKTKTVNYIEFNYFRNRNHDIEVC